MLTGYQVERIAVATAGAILHLDCYLDEDPVTGDDYEQAAEERHTSPGNVDLADVLADRGDYLMTRFAVDEYRTAQAEDMVYEAMGALEAAGIDPKSPVGERIAELLYEQADELWPVLCAACDNPID